MFCNWTNGLGKTIPEFSADCRKRADRCRNSCHAKKDEIAEIDEDEGEDEDWIIFEELFQ